MGDRETRMIHVFFFFRQDEQGCGWIQAASYIEKIFKLQMSCLI